MTEASTPVTPGDLTRSARLLMGLLGVIVLALLSWQVVVHSYELERGSFGGGGPDAQIRHAASTSARYAYGPERSYELHFAVRNPDRLPVRIEGLDEDRFPGLRVERLLMVEDTPERGCCPPDAMVPFHPVDLAAGAEVYLFATLRLERPPVYQGTCSHESWTTAPVRFSVLGTRRHQDVPLLVALVIERADEPGCAV